MRKKRQKQMPLMHTNVDHPHAQELEYISRILERQPTINELALQDLIADVRFAHCGAEGMSAEQVVRSAIIKQMNQFSYDQLAFHLVDSRCYRNFCKIGIADKGFGSSTLCDNIKALSDDTWQAIHRIVIDYAKEQKIEKGRKSRFDCTVVETNIHKPYDSTLLWDAVRVLTRLLKNVAMEFKTPRIVYADHCRRAKRRMLGIHNAKTQKQRKKLYKDLLKVTQKTVNYAYSAIDTLKKHPLAQQNRIAAVQALSHYVDLAGKVIDQTQYRMRHGKSVPASEKIVSIFEPHTDIIVKDNRDTLYGHKICIAGGSSGLITDCIIVEGNPADTTLTEQMLDRQNQIYGRYPLKVAFDGGFASRQNLQAAKQKQIKDVCFGKKRGLNVEDMCRSEWVFKQLRRFRAGIESAISWIKRCFGLSRCNWKGHRSFKSYVWSAIVSANLLTIARKQLA
jgi:IS5 family transposase